MGLKDENAVLKRRIDILEEEAASRRQLMDQHGDDLNKALQLLDAERAELAEARQEAGSLAKQLAVKQERCDRLSSQLEQLQIVLQEWQDMHSELTAQNQELTAAAETNATTIADLSAAVKALSTK